MVVVKNCLPLIQNDQGVAIKFDNEWLKAALDRAAHKAGYDGWCLSDDFSAAVSQYLRHDYGGKVIELTGLEKVVRATLRDIGYDEIAVRFRAVNPFQRVSLVDCLKTSGGKQGPLFFKRLTERIKTLHAAEVQHFHFYDLQTCAHRLLENDPNPSWWSGPLMCARIVGFVRERVLSLAWKREMKCTIR